MQGTDSLLYLKTIDGQLFILVQLCVTFVTENCRKRVQP